MKKSNTRTLKIAVLCFGLAVFMMYTTFGTTASASATAKQDEVKIKAFGITDYQNNQPIYMMVLKVADVKGAKYVIEREEIGSTDRIKILECSYEVMARNQFQYRDIGGLTKHKRYRYCLRLVDETGQATEVSVIALVKNLSFKDEAPKYFPVEYQSCVMFKLGPKCDLEGENLEYRLYTRIPGGGGEKLLASWRPQKDQETVTTILPDTCEWQLVCIETDDTIPDRSESVLVDWSLFVKS